jgi:hypothetical protein
MFSSFGELHSALTFHSMFSQARGIRPFILWTTRKHGRRLLGILPAPGLESAFGDTERRFAPDTGGSSCRLTFVLHRFLLGCNFESVPGKTLALKSEQNANQRRILPWTTSRRFYNRYHGSLPKSLYQNPHPIEIKLVLLFVGNPDHIPAARIPKIPESPIPLVEPLRVR